MVGSTIVVLSIIIKAKVIEHVLESASGKYSEVLTMVAIIEQLTCLLVQIVVFTAAIYNQTVWAWGPTHWTHIRSSLCMRTAAHMLSIYPDNKAGVVVGDLLRGLQKSATLN